MGTVPLETQSAQQDEREAPLPGKTQEDRMNLARTVYAISASKTEPRPERREWFDAGFKAGVADRAAKQVQADAGAVPAGLLDALRFYANGSHFTMHDSSAWDTVSGEPPNFYEDESNTATVEDGSIAKLALQGKFFTDQEYTEPPVEGEVFGVMSPAAESVHPDHLKLLRPFMSARDGRLTHSLTVYLREMADPEFAKRTHEARKRLYGAAAESDKSQAARDVLAERQRQISAEGWTPEHDDEHGPGVLAAAAFGYLFSALNAMGKPVGPVIAPPPYWPWDASWFKPGQPRRMMEKAGALIIAEIERLDRAAMSREQSGGE